MSTVLVESSATELHPPPNTPTDVTLLRGRPMDRSPSAASAGAQERPMDRSPSAASAGAQERPPESRSQEHRNPEPVRQDPPLLHRDGESDARADVDDSPIARLVLAKERAQAAARTHDDSAQRRTARPLGLPVTALTTDAKFAAQLRAALDGIAEVTIVASADEAAALAASHRCPILVTDVTLTRSAVETLTTRLHAHDPASVLIVAGNRDQGGAFISLQSSGTVGGFLLKPATAAATQLVVESATRRYRTHAAGDGEPTRMRVRARTNRTHPPKLVDAAALEGSTVEAHAPRGAPTVAPLAPAVPVATARTQPPKRSLPLRAWALALAAAIIVGGGVWWVMYQRMPDIDPQQVIAEHLARAQSAQLAGRWVGPRNSAAYHLQTVLALDPHNFAAQRGLDRVAAELSRQTQAHMSQRRLAEAIASIERLRDLQPDYAELPLLDSQLNLLRDAVLATHAPPPPVDTTPVASRSPSAAGAGAQERPKAARPLESPRTIEPSATVARAAPSPPAVKPAEPKIVPIAQPVAAKTAPTQNSPPTPTGEAPRIETPAPSMPAPIETQTPQTSPALPPAQVAAPAAAAPAAPTILKYVPPMYPSEAYSRGIEGWVQVSLSVLPNGSVANARVEDGEKRQLFSRAALAAVKQWKYTTHPEANGEMPVSVRVDFKLNR